MLKLIHLEIRKINFWRYILGAIAACFVFTGMLFFSLYADRNDLANTISDFFFVVDSTRMIFIVFAGVLISRLIIEEYHDKTISLMFTYPISRKKIIISKLLIIICSTFFFILASRIIVAAILYMLNNSLHFIDGEITIQMITEYFRNTIIYDLSFSGISLVSLFFGMLKKSVRTTIIASIIIAVFFGISNEDLSDVSISSFLVRSLIFAVIGVIATYFSIRNIEQKDVL
ncbi:ABC transporter permease [Oceanobacillus sojae]|uniref:ABC transporter permease n=1 Tax=Oceanobacillus sojae TaxID=582851 RepID=UPI0009884C6B|nr:ABC transporter permease [Oceanobacillus sojae]